MDRRAIWKRTAFTSAYTLIMILYRFRYDIDEMRMITHIP